MGLDGTLVFQFSKSIHSFQDLVSVIVRDTIMQQKLRIP